jgi:hypothetical protein
MRVLLSSDVAGALQPVEHDDVADVLRLMTAPRSRG